jgi:hypothetical protein
MHSLNAIVVKEAEEEQCVTMVNTAFYDSYDCKKWLPLINF